jgi:hypothetical protein
MKRPARNKPRFKAEWRWVCRMPGVTERLMVSSPSVCGVWAHRCCDSSQSQHASKHAAAIGYPIIASFEPGEDWFFDYEKRGMIKGVELLPPHSHPEDQPVPGSAGRVPANWDHCCTSWRRPIFYEWEQDSVLFIGAVEECAGMTRLVQLRTSKRNRSRHLLHSISPQKIERPRWDITRRRCCTVR